MSTIKELGSAVHTRRTDMGLSQTSLAKLAALSRSTVNQLENGTAIDLSLARATRLLSVLGLMVTVSSPRPKLGGPARSKSSPLELAARTSSVSYTESIKPTQLREVLLSGHVPPKFVPHISTLLDEAPMSLLAGVVDQLHAEESIDRPLVWKTYKSIALSLFSDRKIWS